MALPSQRNGAFDILITDLMMPEMDGIALLREARNLDADLVGIVMTGHGEVHTAVEATACRYRKCWWNSGVAID